MNKNRGKRKALRRGRGINDEMIKLPKAKIALGKVVCPAHHFPWRGFCQVSLAGWFSIL